MATATCAATDALTVGNAVQRRGRDWTIGTITALWTARARTKEVSCPNPSSYQSGYKRIPERRMARVAWPSTMIGRTVQHSDVQIDTLRPARRCPECGSPMIQSRTRNRGNWYRCVRAEREQTVDERGHLGRIAGAKHPYVRCWSEDELATGGQG